MSLAAENKILRDALTEIQQIAADALAETPTPLPGMIWGQTRYLDYEVSPGCTDCQNVFPQGCDLLRIHDSQCSFFQIATEPGVYNWSILDKHLDSCEQRGIQVLYTFAYTPAWAVRSDFVPLWDEPGAMGAYTNYPPDLNAFEDFVRALLDHVRRPDGTFRIQYLEAWNETNSLAYWCGTDDILMEQQQMLWRVLEEVAPSVLLTTPTPTKNYTSVPQAMDTYLSMGFQNYSHIVSFHGYCDVGSPGNAIGPTLEELNEVMAKYGCTHPTWDTEFNWTQGYRDDGSIPADQVPQWIKGALLTRMKYGVACAIWFQWDSPNACGPMIVDWRGQITAAGLAWVDYYNSIHSLPAVSNLMQV